MIKKALIKKFGSNRVVDKNKAIRILSNSYTTDADVVVAFQYRNYSNSTNYQEEIYFKALFDNSIVINYPKIHIKNGNKKMFQQIICIKKWLEYLKK